MSGALDLKRTCPEFRRQLGVSRRGFVQAGMLGGSALSLAGLLRAEDAAPASARRREPAVIILWMRGGPSHIDMWDPKPDAPVEFRGEFGTAATSVPGIQLTDMLPACGRIMDKWSIVRSLHHADAGHSGADQICFTGYPSGPSPDINVMPSCGSIVARQLGQLNPNLPAYVMIPRMDPGTGPAHLGVAYKPFETLADPANPGPFRVPNFALAEGLSLERLGKRQALRESFDRVRREVDVSGQMGAMDRFHLQAWDILTSPAAQAAFDLDAEPAALRERYGFAPPFDPHDSRSLRRARLESADAAGKAAGRGGGTFGDGRLALVGHARQRFRVIAVGFPAAVRPGLLGPDRRSVQRGLLESTLVIAWGEFGRTPRVNNDAGRDHYPNVFSAALAGGPIQGGRVVGASDGHGAFPAASPKTPQDVLATLYHHLGINIEQQYVTLTGRPMAVLPSGQVLQELL